MVVAVSDGDQAIARLEASPPDIVLADIGMPGKNGYEVAQYIRQSPRLAHIPVVLLTGAFEPVDEARAAAAGCDGVLAKPFEPQLVIGRVKELLARKRRAPEAIAADGRAAARAGDPVGASARRAAAPPRLRRRRRRRAGRLFRSARRGVFQHVVAGLRAAGGTRGARASGRPGHRLVHHDGRRGAGGPAMGSAGTGGPGRVCGATEPAKQSEPEDLPLAYAPPSPPASPVPSFELAIADAPVPQAHVGRACRV